MNDKSKEILLMLEDAYTGARMSDDLDTMLRLARAIVAFKFDTDKDVPQVDEWWKSE